MTRVSVRDATYSAGETARAARAEDATDVRAPVQPGRRRNRYSSAATSPAASTPPSPATACPGTALPPGLPGGGGAPAAVGGSPGPSTFQGGGPDVGQELRARAQAGLEHPGGRARGR